MRKTDLQPDSDVGSDQIAGDETLIGANGQRHWLFTAVDPKTTDLATNSCFRRERRNVPCCFFASSERTNRCQRAVPGDDAAHLKAALDRLGLRFRVCRRGN